jgi:hypothetical protein
LAPKLFRMPRPMANTLLVKTPNLIITPHLRKVNYDPVTSFEPIWVNAPTVIVVNSASPYRTLADRRRDRHLRPRCLESRDGPGDGQLRRRSSCSPRRRRPHRRSAEAGAPDHGCSFDPKTGDQIQRDGRCFRSGQRGVDQRLPRSGKQPSGRFIRESSYGCDDRDLCTRAFACARLCRPRTGVDINERILVLGLGNPRAKCLVRPACTR